MDTSILFHSIQLNSALSLKNRIVMAPMTRCMAKPDGTATPLMAEYYARRADAGLIITEGTVIRPDGTGYLNVPKIYTPKHMDAWKLVTEAVHGRDGKIFMQIWHVGRVSHPFFINNQTPVSPSATEMSQAIPRMRHLQYGKARAVSLDEIHQLIDAYGQAAHYATQAGFDGIEIHGANGYLIDQFLHYHTNLRDDSYGGTAENRARFALEVVDACIQAIGAQKVGLRLSPAAYLNEIVSDPRDADVFRYLLKQLNTKQIAYVHTGNFDDSVVYAELEQKTMSAFIKTYYEGFLIACGGYNIELAESLLQSGQADLIAFGRPFIANPDLVTKLKHRQTLTEYDAKMLDRLY